MSLFLLYLFPFSFVLLNTIIFYLALKLIHIFTIFKIKFIHIFILFFVSSLIFPYGYSRDFYRMIIGKYMQENNVILPYLGKPQYYYFLLDTIFVILFIIFTFLFSIYIIKASNQFKFWNLIVLSGALSIVVLIINLASSTIFINTLFQFFNDTIGVMLRAMT